MMKKITENWRGALVGINSVVSWIQQCYVNWNRGMQILVGQIITFKYLLSACSVSETAIGAGWIVRQVQAMVPGCI